jgi:hypothetical protein
VQLDGLLAPRDMVDLERHVVQVEALLEQVLEPPPRAVTVGVG